MEFRDRRLKSGWEAARGRVGLRVRILAPPHAVPAGTPPEPPRLGEQGSSAVASEVERQAMSRALALAARGLGATSPNPVVGAVVLDSSGAVVGEGFHARAGGPHAEVVALEAAGSAAAGGTVVVTLEPCAHTGRTGPCTKALQAAGVRRVVYAAADPTAAAGGGGNVLRQAGIDVEAGLLAGEAALGNEAWLHAARTRRPFVTWKYAATLDGRIAAADASSRWITSAAARGEVHQLRAASDAIMVGTGTVLADDPALTVRTAGVDATGERTAPLRVVVGRRPIPPGARILDGSAPTLRLTETDPREVLARLRERDIVSVLLEGGPTLAGAFWRAGCVDKVVGYLAPKLLGAGRQVLGEMGITSITGALALHIDDVARVGDDVRIIARPRREGT